jgi:hypothetical protein
VAAQKNAPTRFLHPWKEESAEVTNCTQGDTIMMWGSRKCVKKPKKKKKLSGKRCSTMVNKKRESRLMAGLGPATERKGRGTIKLMRGKAREKKEKKKMTNGFSTSPGGITPIPQTQNVTKGLSRADSLDCPWRTYEGLS